MNENMNGSNNCPRCGAANAMGVNFCVSCGQSLVNGDVAAPEAPVAPVMPEPVPPIMPMGVNPEPAVNMPQNDMGMMQGPAMNNNMPYNNGMNNMMNNNMMMNQNMSQQNNYVPNYNNVNTGKFNFFTYMLGALLKPFDKFKSEEENLGNFKNVGLLILIITGALTILGLIDTMISAVRITSFWSDEVEWVWENLKNIEYIKVIGSTFLIYAGVIFAITGVYYLAALVLKKDVKFPKLLGATTTAFLPAAVSMSILSPILSLIYSPLGIGVTAVGCVYAVIIFIELVNELVAVENKNTRIYYHVACLSIIIIAGALIAYNLVLGSVSSGLGDLMGGLGDLGGLY